MRSFFFRRLALSIAFTATLTGVSVAQPTSSPSGYPGWTGASYPFDQHLTIMILHLDDAALAIARQAQQTAKSESTKKLAAGVVAERTSEIASIRSAYDRRYGQAPPAWPTPQVGYGPGMMGGGYGPGMMGRGYRPGMMGGGYGAGMMGMMMGYGDVYQMMMGGRSNWWGSANADTGLVPALIRLDAMQISMATLAVTSNDADTKSVAHRIVSARTAELSRLSGNLPL